MQSYHEVYFVVLAFLSEVIGTLSGVSSSTIFVPLAQLLESAQVTLALTASLHVLGNLVRAVLYRKNIDWLLTLKFGVVSFLFTGLGAQYSNFLPQSTYSIALGFFLVFISSYFLFFKNQHLFNGRWLPYAGGAISGLLTGLLGSGGAIRSLALSTFNLNPMTFIATSTLIDFGGDILRLFIYLKKGYLNTEHYFYIPILALVALSANWLAKMWVKNIKQDRFQKIVLIGVFFMGLISLFAGLSVFSKKSSLKPISDFVSSTHSVYQFSCDTVRFGERLPLKLIEINPQFNKTCGDLCAKKQVIRYADKNEFTPIPNQWIKKQIEFNSKLAQPDAKTKHNLTTLQPIKRAVFVNSSNQVYILETRYIYYPYPNFKITLKCDSESSCSGYFAKTENDNKKMILNLQKDILEDSRSPTTNIRAEMMFGPREKSRLIVRIFKENGPYDLGQNTPLSSSGETTINPTDEIIELDVGVDEQLKLYTDTDGPVFERVAAAELKLVCHKITE